MPMPSSPSPSPEPVAPPAAAPECQPLGHRTVSLPSSLDEHSLTYQQPRTRLPPFWRCAFRGEPALRDRIQRMYVVGDGSCAGGAVLLGLVAPEDAADLMPLSQLLPPLTHSPEQVAAFQSHHIAAVVNGWTSDDWLVNVPMELRDEFWNDLPPCCCPGGRTACTCARSGRTPERELTAFRAALALPTGHMGSTFFHVVAGILNVGILLLMDDHRLRGTARVVWDFGTGDYPFTIVLFALHSAPRSDAGWSSACHFETVGLASDSPPSTLDTLFQHDHPVVTTLRAFAIERSCERTLDQEHINYRPFPRFPAVAPAPSTCPLAPSLDAPQLPSCPPGAARARPLRLRRPPRRFDDQCDGDHSSLTAPPTRSRPSPPIDVQPGSSPDPAHHFARRNRQSARRCPPHQCSAVPAPDDRQIAVPGPDRPPSPSPPTPAHPSLSPAVAQGVDDGAPTRSSVVEPAPLRPPCPPGQRPWWDTGSLVQLCSWVRTESGRGRLRHRVPYSLVPLWTFRCRTVLRRLEEALSASPMDEAEVLQHLLVFYRLPKAVFGLPDRTRGGKKGRTQRYHRIGHRLSDPALVDTVAEDVRCRLRALSSATVSASADPAMPRADEPHAGEADARTARRVEYLFRAGHLRRALQALSSTASLADLDLVEERQRLRHLHPPCPPLPNPAGLLSNGQEHAMPQCPSPADNMRAIDFDSVQRLMRETDKGSAPGPSGLGSNFISVLATDAHCVQAMSVLVQHIVNNTLPDTVRRLLTSSVLVSLDKGGDGRRPVAMGELVVKMAGRYALSLVMAEARAVLHPHQYGVGIPDGCAQVVHSIRHLLCDMQAAGDVLAPRGGPQLCATGPSSGRPLACLSIDMRNAFNTLDRRVMLTKLYGTPGLRACWNMAAFAYGQPSLLVMQCSGTVADCDACIESRNGVRQGDPLASLLFCLAMHDTYGAIAREVIGGCLAFVDDGHAVGTLEQCWRVWQRLPGLLAPLGLTLNPLKCEVTCFYTDQLTHADDVAALHHFQRALPGRVNTRSLRLLGSVVGIDDAAEAATLHSDKGFCDDQLVAMRRLPLLSRTTAGLALPYLAGSVLTHRLRAMSPAATAAHAAQYDARVRAAAHALIGIVASDGDRYDRQISLPHRLGGFGLATAVEVAPAAFIAGVECALRNAPALVSLWEGSLSLPPASRLSLAIDDCLLRLRRTVAALKTASASRSRSSTARSTAGTTSQRKRLHLPTSASSFISHFRAQPASKRIQSDVSHSISLLSFNAGLAQAERGEGGVRDVARLRALRTKESSLWLRTMPTCDALRLSDEDWRWSARLRLGMPMPFGPSQPPGCSHDHAATTDDWHPLSCAQAYGSHITRRHHAVVHVIAHHCRLAHLHARIEPSDLCADRSRRPDIQVDLPGASLLGDVTILQPSCPQWRRTTARRGAAASGNSRAASKARHYEPLLRAHRDVRFEPIVLYAHGGFHASALRFLNQLVKAVEPATCLISRAAWKRSLLQHVAMVVQRGNAAIMRAHHNAHCTRVIDRYLSADDDTSAGRASSAVASATALFSPPRLDFSAGDAASSVMPTWSRPTAELDADEEVIESTADPNEDANDDMATAAGATVTVVPDGDGDGSDGEDAAILVGGSIDAMEVEPVARESDGSLPCVDGGRTTSSAFAILQDTNDNQPMPLSLC